MSTDYGTVAERVTRGITWIREEGERFDVSLDRLRERVQQLGDVHISDPYTCPLAMAGGHSYGEVMGRILPTLSEEEARCAIRGGHWSSTTGGIHESSDRCAGWPEWAVAHGFMSTWPDVDATWRELGDEWRFQLGLVSEVSE